MILEGRENGYEDNAQYNERQDDESDYPTTVPAKAVPDYGLLGRSHRRRPVFRVDRSGHGLPPGDA
jgi:hypothetical protein